MIDNELGLWSHRRRVAREGGDALGSLRVPNVHFPHLVAWWGTWQARAARFQSTETVSVNCNRFACHARRKKESEAETSGYEPFTLHASIHLALGSFRVPDVHVSHLVACHAQAAPNSFQLPDETWQHHSVMTVSGRTRLGRGLTSCK